MLKIEIIGKYKNNRSYIQTIVCNDTKMNDTHIWQAKRCYQNIFEKIECNKLKSIIVNFKKDDMYLAKDMPFIIDNLLASLKEGAKIDDMSKSMIELFNMFLEKNISIEC